MPKRNKGVKCIPSVAAKACGLCDCGVATFMTVWDSSHNAFCCCCCSLHSSWWQHRNPSGQCCIANKLCSRKLVCAQFIAANAKWHERIFDFEWFIPVIMLMGGRCRLRTGMLNSFCFTLFTLIDSTYPSSHAARGLHTLRLLTSTRSFTTLCRP